MWKRRLPAVNFMPLAQLTNHGHDLMSHGKKTIQCRDLQEPRVVVFFPLVSVVFNRFLANDFMIVGDFH